MNLLKFTTYISPTECLGDSVRVFLKLRASDKETFHFKIMECGEGYISGYDQEGLNLRIDLEDIDFILGT